jgi:ubiquinone/menaquinone biosynthesis C-methylase UbiE
MATNVAPKTFYESLGAKVINSDYFTPAIDDYRRTELDYLQKNIPEGATVLEVLCGKGRRVVALAPKVKHITGIERSPVARSMAEREAKKHKNVKIIDGDGTKIPFEDGHFDYSFIAFNNLFTLPHEKEILAEIARVTKKKVFISAYGDGSLAERLKFYEKCGFDIVSINHGHVFTREGFNSWQLDSKKIMDLFSSAGLSVKVEKLCEIGNMCVAEKVTP